MFDSLLRVKFSWPFFVVAAIIIRLIFIEVSWVSWLAIVVTLHQFILLFNAIGHIVPIRYLLGSFMCLQFFVGPVFAYNGLDAYQYEMYIMRVPEPEYFAYALPGVLLFILGLHIHAGKCKGEVLNQPAIQAFVKKNPRIPYLFIVVGFTSSVAGSFFASELAFIFYLLGGFKFIGLFLLVLGEKTVKPVVL